jgi:hypothetical protein
VDLTDERWHFVAGTYDGEKLCLYIDGNLSNFTQVNGNMVIEDGIVFLGDYPKWGGGAKNLSWNGLIDDVRIYSYALSAEEVKMLYEGKEPPREKISE